MDNVRIIFLLHSDVRKKPQAFSQVLIYCKYVWSYCFQDSLSHLY